VLLVSIIRNFGLCSHSKFYCVKHLLQT